MDKHEIREIVQEEVRRVLEEHAERRRTTMDQLLTVPEKRDAAKQGEAYSVKVSLDTSGLAKQLRDLADTLDARLGVPCRLGDPYYERTTQAIPNPYYEEC